MRISFAVATAALCATVAHAQAQAGHHHHEKRLLDNLGLATVNAQLDSVLANGNKGLLNQVLSVLGLEVGALLRQDAMVPADADSPRAGQWVHEREYGTAGRRAQRWRCCRSRPGRVRRLARPSHDPHPQPLSEPHSHCSSSRVAIAMILPVPTPCHASPLVLRCWPRTRCARTADGQAARRPVLRA